MPEKEHTDISSRRDFLKTAAVVAAAAGGGSATPVQASGQQQAASKDPYAIAARFNKYLRVTDVTDGLDAVGRADLTLMDPAIRPLWMGMRFSAFSRLTSVIKAIIRSPRFSACSSNGANSNSGHGDSCKLLWPLCSANMV
jgi:hypothetical protein